MARPPATKDGDRTIEFIVKKGYIINDFEGNRKHSGENITLTKAQADYFQDLEAITVDMGSMFSEDDTTDDKAETVSEPDSDGGGKSALRGLSGLTASKD